MTATPPVLAAGAVCWRVVDGKPRVLLVHRGDRADVSLPKGKLDPGETLPQTAKRELLEETGLTVTLGAPLGTVEYELPSGKPKIVYYWSAEIDEHALELATFTPNHEIAALEWTSVAKAVKKLSYPHDIAIVERFAERFAANAARTFALIALRHGKAVPAESWDGPDSTRPLMQRGNDQALSIASAIAAFAPAKLISSTAVRCQSTVAPLAGFMGLPVKSSGNVSQEWHERGIGDVAKVVRKRIAKRRSAVICSHGPVLPEIVTAILAQTGGTEDPALRKAAMLSTGEYTVFHLALEDPASRIVAVETHGPADN